MTRILIYDDDDKRIDRICDEKDMTTAELIEVLLDAVDDGEIEI